MEEWLEWPSWLEVGELTYLPSNSQILLRRNGYRQILEAELTLQYGLRLPWERGVEIAQATGDTRPIFELYEYWCYFMLRKVLRSICGEERYHASSLYTRSSGGLQIALRKGKTSALIYVYKDGSTRVEVSLYYNRSFRRGNADTDFTDASYSTQFDPDFSILVSNGTQRHWLHFDAKYRLDLREWNKQVTASTFQDLEDELVERDYPEKDDGHMEDIDTYRKEDVYKMHTYRDAILGSRGAYVIYPGSEAMHSLFVGHRSSEYRFLHDLPSVGAFPYGLEL